MNKSLEREVFFTSPHRPSLRKRERDVFAGYHRPKDAYVCYSLTKSLYLSYTYNSTREILILSYSRRRK